MYNQVNHGPHFGQGSHLPMPPAYQQAPPPPTHVQQGPPAPLVQRVPTAVSPNIRLPAPHVYLPGPPSTSSTGPVNLPIQVPPAVIQNTAQSYAIPSPLLQGNSMTPQTFSSLKQNSRHSSNLGVQTHHIPPPGPPPPVGHSHQETSWAPGLPTRLLPPPPPPPPSQGQILYKPSFHPCPPQPGDLQSLQHSYNPPPPPPPSGSGFLAPTPDGVYLHSTVGNYQVPSISPPPLPSSPPPILPSPPPLTPPTTSASSHAVHSNPKSSKVSGFESKAVDPVEEVVASYPSCVAPVHNSDPNQDSVILDLPPPPPQPTEEKTIQRIEALCQLIVENGPDIEDKTCQDEYQNPEYVFLFGGEPGTEAAISHSYFLWMKKKYDLEHRRQDKKSESQIRTLAVDSSEQQYHLHVATECCSGADSDMEMEDDITLSDKDQGPNYAIEALSQQDDRVEKEFSMNEHIHQPQNSTENDPAKDILFSGPALLSDSEHVKSTRSVTEVHRPVNDSTEVAESLPDTVLEKSAAPLADDFTRLGASDLSEAINPDRDSGQHIRSGSPIRLLQDYASDDTSDNEDETCAADASVLTVSAGAATGVSAAHKDSGSYLQKDIGSKSPSNTQKGFNDSEISAHLVQEFKGTHKRSVSHWSSDGGNDGLGGTGIDSGSKIGNAEQEDVRKTPKVEVNILKVDEFGRHPRECPTDSDSDDLRYRQTRRQNKRDRSWSRSRSPLDRRSRRRRRSPRRRKNKRSQSRSWSPRNRRSRSWSPIFRRSGGFSGEIVKREKGQCLDFLRGKCYRGASCWYIHHESDKNAGSRRSRNKHDLEVSSPKNSSINEGTKNISSKVSGHECGVRDQYVDLRLNVTGQEVKQREEASLGNAVVSATSGFDGQSVYNDPIQSESFREVAAEVQESLVFNEEPKAIVQDNKSFQKAVNSHRQLLVDGFHPEPLSSGDALKPSLGTYEDVIPLEDVSSVQRRQSNAYVGVSEHSGYPSQHISSSFVSDSSPDKRSMASVSKVSGSEPLPYMLPSTQLQSATGSLGPWISTEQPSLDSQASKELPPNNSLAELPIHTHQLPPPPVLSHSQSENVVHMAQMSREYGAMQHNQFFPFQSTTKEKFQTHPPLLHTQNSQFSVPPNSYWTSLPQPSSQVLYSSRLDAGVAKSYVSSEFNQSQLYSRIDFVSQSSVKPGLPSHSHGSEYQDQTYPSMQEHSRSIMHAEGFSPNPLPQGNPASQSLTGPNLGRQDHYKQLSMQDSKFSSSTSFGSLHPQPKHFSWESDVNRLQPSSGGKLPPGEHFKTSSHIHPLSQKRQPIYNFQYSASEGTLSVPGKTVTVPRYPPDVLDGNHSTSLPAFGGSRISAHYNPYASTFEQPLSSKFTSSIFRQEKDIIHGNNYGSSRLNHTPINVEGVSDVGSIQTASSPKSPRAVGQILPRSGGDQYDPLFDSIEPSSTSHKKFDFDQKQEVTGESNISLRPKSSYKSLDVEEKNKHEEVGAVASTTSQNNDEYGESADAEVGAVENESLSNEMDAANRATGEVEINQIKSPGKRRKSKDSRSMKLFKISIASFVKEVLKPSWRQGNMSKVAFKTIVKKTVDKVAGAMKGHRVPKSQAKINQYIDSSQRKLTKLVMGYVDKYVKA